MGWWALGAGALSVGGQLYAADKSQKIANRNARNAWRQTKEEVRRLERQQDATEEEAIATIGASGVKYSGTARDYLRDLTAEHERQTDWALKAGRMRYKEIKKGGQAAWYQGAIGAATTAIGAWGDFTQTDDYTNTFG